MQSNLHVIWGDIEQGSGTSSSPNDWISGEAEVGADGGGGTLHMLPQSIRQHLIDAEVVRVEESPTSEQMSPVLSGSTLVSQRVKGGSSRLSPAVQRAASGSEEATTGPRATFSSATFARGAGGETGGLGGGGVGPGSVKALMAALSDSERQTIRALVLEYKEMLHLDLGDFWSKGSGLHSKGTCKPCHYAHTKRGCANGKDCEFCHIPHASMGRARPCRSKRMQSKRFDAMLEGVNSEDPAIFGEGVEKLTTLCPPLWDALSQHIVQEAGRLQFQVPVGQDPTLRALQAAFPPEDVTRKLVSL